MIRTYFALIIVIVNRLINGHQQASQLFVKAIHDNAPVVIFKHSGGTADIASEMMEHAMIYVNKKRANRMAEPECPFPPVAFSSEYAFNGWLEKFNDEEKDICVDMNVLIENWPDRFNETSVYVLDMFKDSEDDMQDYLTRTMAVAFEGTNELGDTSADNKRLTYAWRLRYKLLWNSKRFKFMSDVLMLLFIFFNLSSTLSAVMYVYFSQINKGVLTHAEDNMLLSANLLLPLVSTILRGILSVLSPTNKYHILKDAASQIESEIYMYRSKVGVYNPRKSLINNADGDDVADDEPPRKLFSAALDRIMATVSEGEFKSAAITAPTYNSGI